MSKRSIYLRDQAVKCRWHADDMTDVETQAALRKLATEYVARADEIDNSEPPDVLQFDRTTEPLEQENVWLKGQLARIKRAAH
jgi:hypothetical protein